MGVAVLSAPVVPLSFFSGPTCEPGFPHAARSLYYLLLAGSLLDVLFDTKDGGSMLPRNVGEILPDYTA
jgi:hypothetical protein